MWLIANSLNGRASKTVALLVARICCNSAVLISGVFSFSMSVPWAMLPPVAGAAVGAGAVGAGAVVGVAFPPQAARSSAPIRKSAQTPRVAIPFVAMDFLL